MGGIIDKITDFIKDMLKGWVLSNLETMFTDVNDKVGTIAGEVSKTPSSWNSGIFSMVQTLSENVIVPIAGMIISFVLVYELITMVIDKRLMGIPTWKPGLWDVSGRSPDVLQRTVIRSLLRIWNT